jgi:hypothetical protein
MNKDPNRDVRVFCFYAFWFLTNLVNT